MNSFRHQRFSIGELVSPGGGDCPRSRREGKRATGADNAMRGHSGTAKRLQERLITPGEQISRPE